MKLPLAPTSPIWRQRVDCVEKAESSSQRAQDSEKWRAEASAINFRAAISKASHSPRHYQGENLANSCDTDFFNTIGRSWRFDGWLSLKRTRLVARQVEQE